LLTLSPTGHTQLVLAVDEKNLRQLALGQRAIASADAFAQDRFAAELVYINPAVNAQTGAVEVKLDVAAPPSQLRQDMTVSVDIEVARRPSTLVLPASSVHDADNTTPSTTPWVLRVRGRHAQRQNITLGMRSGAWVEVLAGLAECDEVVPTGAAVAAGGRLRVAPAATPTSPP
jgi:HlyD family secretion protein